MENEHMTELRKRYEAAADSFVGKLKDDPNVIAVIICGSLAYDTVWEKSDIDTTVIVRDQVLKTASYCVIEDDILINVNLTCRSDFKRGFERMWAGSFMQSYYSRGKMVYTTDDSLYEYYEEMKQMDMEDIDLYLFFTACELVGIYEKCRKWFTVKQDYLYTQYYILKSAELIARMEVCLHGESPNREAIKRAASINPGLTDQVYQSPMSHLMSAEELQGIIETIDTYLEQHLDTIKQPVIDFMKDGDIKTVTLITRHFHTDSHFIVGIFDYLAEKGILEKVSQTIRITPKSKLAVEELGYLYIPFE